ncbi:MAG: hypothetical protein H6651_02645 [Ardenticatenales bacterium]|nr:hypothetical protein [Ardenticatenales bacterium]
MITDAFAAQIFAALRALRVNDSDLVTHLRNLRLFQQALIREQAAPPQQLARAILDKALDTLKQRAAATKEQDPQNEEIAAIVDAFYFQGESRRSLAERFNISTATLSRRQKDGADWLIQIIWDAEQLEAAPEMPLKLKDFPVPEYRRTFGLDKLLLELEPLTEPGDNQHMLLLTGLGGIGKTTVAMALAYHVARQPWYKQLLFVGLPGEVVGQTRSPEEYWDLAVGRLISFIAPGQNLLPLNHRERMLREALSEREYLILIDNIESTAVVSYFLEQLRTIVGRSFFIITSRNQPQNHIVVPARAIHELSKADARALLLFHLQDQGVARRDEVSEEHIEQILAITNGHPQAILLITTLLKRSSLAEVIDAFASGQGQPVEALYHDIFERTWEKLSIASQTLLLAIYNFSPAGGTAAELTAISNLTADQFLSTVQELSLASILEIQGNFTERRYALHQLTLNFLTTRFDESN